MSAGLALRGIAQSDDWAPPRLPPRLDPLTRRLLHADRAFLFELARGIGSPCHLVLPEAMATNVARFLGVFDLAGTDGRLFFALKANKSTAFIETAAAHGIGADVASTEELSAALGAGIRGTDIVVTGPHKSPDLHILAARQRATITLDCPSEVEALEATLSGMGAEGATAVLLRYRPESEHKSRFGMSSEGLVWALRRLRGHGLMRLAGFSVHLSGYDVAARREAGFELVDWCATARSLGLAPDIIDLGGGWPVSYVDAEAWTSFRRDMGDRAVYHAGRVPASVYPYHSEIAGADALVACLTTPGRTGRSLARQLSMEGLRLAVEPGRALLDQAGFTVVGILGASERDDGYGTVVADGQSFSLSEQWFGSEFLVEPVLLRASNGPAATFVACVAGASCLDADMWTWRKIAFPARPGPGDLLVYVNTAGYQMDSNETAFHRRPLPEKVAVWRDGQDLLWCLDRLYPGRRYARAARRRAPEAIAWS